jgi:hypothetical protein
MTTRKPVSPDPWDFETLLCIDKRIDAAEAEGITERWEFGRLMLAAREGKKRLPNGYLAELVSRTGKSQRELSYRIQFAERYPTEAELRNALRDYSSWHDMVEHLAAKPEDGGESDEEFLARIRAEHEASKGADGRATFTIPATIEELKPTMERLVEEIRRLTRIQFEKAFAAAAELPRGYRRDAREVGLQMRWMRTNVVWLMDDGMSIEEIAQAIGTSVSMVETYLEAPTSSNEEYFVIVFGASDDDE